LKQFEGQAPPDLKLQARASTLAGPNWQTLPPNWSICHRLSLLAVFLRFHICCTV